MRRLEVDTDYMRRALQLARLGEGFTSPNPMVGAVIVADGRIIGEGYHRRYGGPHAEVWAMRSVPEADRHLIPGSTVYVTLEPCSHYGKTPPCAAMLVEKGVGRVVVGCKDPNPRVAGRGIDMLRKAGIEVEVGVLEDECLAVNRRFIVAQTMHRPYVLLKWASSADGFLDRDRGPDESPAMFSTALTSQTVHGLRAVHDAIAVGARTVLRDDPRLDVRHIAGRSPRPVVIDRRGTAPSSARIFSREGVIYLTSERRTDIPDGVEQIIVAPDATPADMVKALGTAGVSSLMVEGGACLLKAFIDDNMWDDARVEVAPFELGEKGIAPLAVPAGTVSVAEADGGNVIFNVKNPNPRSF